MHASPFGFKVAEPEDGRQHGHGHERPRADGHVAQEQAAHLEVARLAEGEDVQLHRRGGEGRGGRQLYKSQ